MDYSQQSTIDRDKDDNYRCEIYEHGQLHDYTGIIEGVLSGMGKKDTSQCTEELRKRMCASLTEFAEGGNDIPTLDPATLREGICPPEPVPKPTKFTVSLRVAYWALFVVLFALSITSIVLNKKNFPPSTRFLIPILYLVIALPLPLLAMTRTHLIWRSTSRAWTVFTIYASIVVIFLVLEIWIFMVR